MNFSTQYGQDQARVLAFTVIAILPAIAFYAFAERQLVSGLTAGSVKG
jgi:raffinose/stachyose/melibiose transport system permease protein